MITLGIDLDNTIIDYDQLLLTLAIERGLIREGSNQSETKKNIRDQIRLLPGGEIEWQKLQAILYGTRIKEAKLFDGVASFLLWCQRSRIPVFIVSHKTQFANYGDQKTNLRKAALEFLSSQGIFSDLGLSEDRVFFESTRVEKVERIRKLGCTHFIDDLQETFDEPSFPSHVQQTLFSPNQNPWNRILESFEKEHEAELRAELSKILNEQVLTLEKIGGGRNSRVYRADTVSKRYAVKHYFKHKADPRDRLSTEFKAFRFLTDRNIREVPKPAFCEPSQGLAGYEFIEGSKISDTQIGTNEILAAVQFLSSLNALKNESQTDFFGPASEACFSLDQLIESIETRLHRLEKISTQGEIFVRMNLFLQKELRPQLSEAICRSEQALRSLGYARDHELDFEDRNLSSSDFGFHNALCRPNGSLAFLDFEYFGWDDPSKTVADFMLHPGMQVSFEMRKLFWKEYLNTFANSKKLQARAAALFPLYGMKWCTILLNEFLPENLERRRFAAHTQTATLQTVLEGQLLKAQQMLYDSKADNL